MALAFVPSHLGCPAHGCGTKPLRRGTSAAPSVRGGLGGRGGLGAVAAVAATVAAARARRSGHTGGMTMDDPEWKGLDPFFRCFNCFEGCFFKCFLDMFWG